MNKIEQHGGWSNQETRLMAWWLAKDEYSHNEVRRIIRTFKMVGEQAHELEHLVWGDFVSREDAETLWKDLLALSLSRMNWLEIIESQKN